MSKKRLGETLQEHGKISHEALQRAVEEEAGHTGIRRNCGEISPEMAATVNDTLPSVEFFTASSSQRQQDAWHPLPLEEVRNQHIRRTLELCRGNRVRAAQLLGIGRTSLYRYLKREPCNERIQEETSVQRRLFHERRTSPRRHLRCTIEITDLATGTCISAVTADCGLYGCFVETTTPFLTGRAVALTIAHDSRTLAITGEVVHATSRRGMGIAFGTLTRGDYGVLAGWLGRDDRTAALTQQPAQGAGD